MWRSKKFIIAVVLAVLAVVGGTSAAVLAASNSDASPPKTLLGRVAEILGIDQQKVEDAFAQAQSEMQDEALDSYLQKLVDEGKITEEEAVQYKAWWQAKPDMGPFQQQLKEWQQAKPTIPGEMKDWQQAKPDVPLPGGFGARGFRGGMKFGRGPCFPGW